MATNRVINTTIDEYIKKREVAIVRRRKLLAAMETRGRITYGHGGLNMNWKVHYKRAAMTAMGGAGNFTADFQANNTYKTAVLPYRSYLTTEAINKMERLQNSGNAAIIKLFSTMVEDRLSDIRDNFANKLYVDATAAGNTNDIYGLDTMFGYSAASANEPIGLPGGRNYAGIPIDLGSLGGSWSQKAGASAWPSGVGDAHYDFWSPLTLDYTSTLWRQSTKTWANTCQDVLHYAIHTTQRNAEALDLIMLERSLWLSWLAKYDDKEHLNTMRSGANSLMVKSGFTDSFNFDGVDITWEYGVPVDSSGYGVGYGLTIDAMELASMQKQLFVTDKDYVLDNFSDRIAIDFYGQLKMRQPRLFCKMQKIS